MSFATMGCCCGPSRSPCNCDPVTLGFASDGDGGLADWYPTAELSPTQSGDLPNIASDMTLVSKAERFCRNATGPFRAAFSCLGRSNQLLGATLRIMTRLTATIEDGIATTIGDHIFLDVTEIDLQTTDPSDTYNRLYYRLGVSIGGVETILQESANTIRPSSLTGTNFIFPTLQSAVASSTGQIKYLVDDDDDFDNFDNWLSPFSVFYAGDYFIASVDAVITGDPTDLTVTAGDVYRLDDRDFPNDPASWTLITDTATEFDDAMLCGGDIGFGATMYLADSAVDFTALTGRHVGFRITDLPIGKTISSAQVVCNNERSLLSPLCDYHWPMIQPAPVERRTPFPVYTGSISGRPSDMTYVNWLTTGFTSISPDLPYLDVVTLPDTLRVDGTIGGVTNEYYYKSLTTYPNFNGTLDYYLYSHITCGIVLYIRQPRERRWTREARLQVTYRQGYSLSSWSAAEMAAGDSDISWNTRPGDAYNHLAESEFSGNFATDQSITLIPNANNTTDVNSPRFTIFEGTINLPVPQP